MQIKYLFMLSWVGDPHQRLRWAGDPANSTRLGRASGQALVCLFPSVNTGKPHPVLQTDIQKSILNCRLGRPAGAKWLEA